MTRVAVVDIGTNSTRLLVADVGAGGVTELDRRSIVTRLGEGLEASGALADAAQERVFSVLDDYAREIDAQRCDVRSAVLTSAVRDASNGERFTELVRDRYGLDASTISGDEEARLTYLGATAARDSEPATLMVVDVGGGSTELVVGAGGEVSFHVSTQVGVVRHTERHLHDDPATPEQLKALRADARETFARELPDDVRARVDHVIAVAGTATMSAAMDLRLEPYDSARVEGHRMTADTLAARLDSLAAVPLSERRKTPGLDPDRAPTIVAGIAILLEALAAVGAGEVEVSDRDILWGRALAAATPERP
jgi:exopolyphosphatase/guanosine-5'-triphosphate,3'-diphosphate pyrophosphatase